MSFGDYLSDGFDRLGTLLPLALVPLFATFLHLDNIRRATSFTGYHLGATFRFPTAIPTFWTFVSLPNQGVGVHVSPTMYFAPVTIVVESVLAAGYLGSVRDAIETGRYDFARNAKEYFVPLLGYTLLVWAVLLVAFGVGVAFAPLLFVALPVMLILSYLFYGTPFLVVVDDCSLGEALRRSNDLAVGGSDADTTYGSFGVGYLVFVFVASLVGTLFINLGVVGVVLGAVLSAPVALALTAATVEFFVDLRGSNPDSTDRPPEDRPPTERPPTERFDY
ncbi:hypothetical protein [Haladaptatus sp. T7]|uniref:hypothetical protein n=1 Tax=Haladaptatus sp. T7 TaxID=2029368 RepID=UPI0021A2560F|nr:hypothetical protein [Haladaptatus sp. T7]GKZ16203.1 hypothetical protein HAL_40840 [Haladaptatus sp. T7]